MGALEGELRLKGPQCFLGYVEAPRWTPMHSTRTGGSAPAIVGLIDDHGNIRVTGRIKDAIIRNAENISALEVETVSRLPTPMSPTSR